MNYKDFFFTSLRKDWYAGNSTLPRLVKNTIENREKIRFCNFPLHWVPIFEWYRVKWNGYTVPREYIPFVSDLPPKQFLEITSSAKKMGMLRSLIESMSVYDPIISDFIYIADNKINLNQKYINEEIKEFTSSSMNKRKKKLLLNSWLAHGRPSIKKLEKKILLLKSTKSIALLLPCALKRPYNESITHKKIKTILSKQGIDYDKAHKIVITSLGLIPEELWNEPTVLNYDAGVPDIYRILRLIRTYFKNNTYKKIYDCLQFEPYSDCIKIVEREGIIKDVIKIKIPCQNHFYIKA